MPYSKFKGLFFLISYMPIVQEFEINPDTRIGIWKIEESMQELKWQLQWGQNDIQQFSVIKNEQRCLHWLSSRVLLRKMLNTCKFIDLKIDEFGKPFLGNSTTHLSISHSGHYVALIISNKDVGIDIQELKVNIENIATKFVNKEEMKELTTESGGKQECLHALWGAKEALYKLYGKKKLDFKENLHIKDLEIETNKGTAIGTISNGNYEKEVPVYFQKLGEYILAFAIDED
jgi:phosphopantetheine--protein transferase-like protein